MKKKALCIMLVAVMVVSAICMFACNPKNVPNDPGFEVPEVGYDGSAITLKFYHTMGANLREVLDNYIIEFNKVYPNITIEHEQVGSYDDVKTQIGTEINVGAQPNIAYCYPDHVASYNVAGAVVQLDNLIASEISVTRADGTTEILGLTEAQKNDFVKGYYDEGAQFGDGKMYSMPFSKSTEVLYYNKDFFELHNRGYHVDENGNSTGVPCCDKASEHVGKMVVPTTWDEMEEVCKIIKEIDPNSIPLGYDSEANWFITMCEQLGSPYTSAEKDNHFLFNNDTNKAFVKRFREWHKKGYVTTQTLYGGYTSGLFTATGDDVKSYMSIGSSAGATHQRPGKDEATGEYLFDVGIATIPQFNPSNPKVISQGPSVCIFDKENPQEVIASWLFVKFLTTSVGFQAEFSMVSGYVPVLKSVLTHPAYAAFLEAANGGSRIAALSAKICMEQEAAYYASPAFNGSSVARSQVETLMVQCLSAKTDNVDALINTAFEDAVYECEYQS